MELNSEGATTKAVQQCAAFFVYIRFMTNKIMNPKKICSIGLLLFVISYIMFPQGSKLAYFQEPIDFAHWFNLIGAILLFSFNNVFPKNNLNTAASIITTLGCIAHIGLCTIDFILWSYGTDDVSRMRLSEHISKYSFCFLSFHHHRPLFAIYRTRNSRIKFY